METRVKENWTDVKKKNKTSVESEDSRVDRFEEEKNRAWFTRSKKKKKMEQIYPVAVIVNLFNLREQIFANSVNGTRVALSSISSKRH